MLSDTKDETKQTHMGRTPGDIDFQLVSPGLERVSRCKVSGLLGFDGVLSDHNLSDVHLSAVK